MKKLQACLIVFCFIAVAPMAFAQTVGCNDIQSGLIVDPLNVVITTGFDDWGYNFQAGTFNGTYCDSVYGINCFGPNPDMSMNWNDAFLSKTDCDGDGKLDRHAGFESYKGSGAWFTNHQSMKVLVDGKYRTLTQFFKAVAVPEDAYSANGNWYTAEGELIGRAVMKFGNDWVYGLAQVEMITNLPGTDTHGVNFLSPVAPGLGSYAE